MSGAKSMALCGEARVPRQDAGEANMRSLGRQHEHSSTKKLLGRRARAAALSRLMWPQLCAAV